MSKAVASDGTVNKLFRQMAKIGLLRVNEKQLDEVLIESKLKQCTYETLIWLQHSYIISFKAKSWPIHAQIIIKAEQSSTWRTWRDGQAEEEPEAEADELLNALANA